MKKILLLLSIVYVGLHAFPQECGNYIELVGQGIYGESEFSIAVTDPDNVDYIIAEAIYKSFDPPVIPTQVKFWSDAEEILADPVTVPINGFQNAGVITEVFRATFEEPAGMIHLDILENPAEFYSLALYIFRKDGSMMSTMNGELYHVYKNEDPGMVSEDEPLVLEIPVPVAVQPRDIVLRFGITELSDDSRWAIFTFEAEGEEELTEVLELRSWDPDAGETRSYTLQEVTFEDVPGEVDKVSVTMFSATDGGDSFIGGIVLLDVPCEYEDKEMFCTYTQGFYGNEGGKTCQGETTPEILERLLAEDLVLGGGENTLTIEAGNVECILGLLPGGGPSKALYGEATCENPAGIEIKNGRLKNTLLAQGITLALNLRNNTGLESFPVDGAMFRTARPLDCMDPEMGWEDAVGEHAFGSEIADFLGEGATIGDLMDLVNLALSGEDVSPLSLSHISDAATLVNEVFDECMLVLGENSGEPAGYGETDGSGDTEGSGDTQGSGDTEGSGDTQGSGDTEGSGEEKDQDEPGKKGITGITDHAMDNELGIFPNPVHDHLYFSLPENSGQFRSASIYSMTGLLISRIERMTLSGPDNRAVMDAASLQTGMYILRVDTESGIFTRRFGVQ